MRTIMFFASPTSSSPEQKLWEFGNKDVCTFLPINSSENWQVYVHKTIDCTTFYQDNQWNLEALKNTIDKIAQNSNECAIFVHCPEETLSQLEGSFEENTKNNILRYSSESGYFKTHIENFKNNPVLESFKKLWNGPVLRKRKEKSFKEMCRLRYKILMPLVVWDLLMKLAGNNDAIQKCKKMLSESLSEDEDFNDLHAAFVDKYLVDNIHYDYLNGSSNATISDYYNIIINMTQEGSLDKLPDIVNDFNKAILDKMQAET